MDEKSILNNGFGSPGETTRALTKEFLKQKVNIKDHFLILRKILIARAFIYKSMGLNILDDSLIDRILQKSIGQLPFVVIADIFVSNKARGEIYIEALIQNLSLVIEVVLENYNSSVSIEDQVIDQSQFVKRVREFISKELE